MGEFVMLIFEVNRLQTSGLCCKPRHSAAIAPAVERTLGKGEVACSNHAGSTIFPVSYQTKANNRRDGLEGYWLALGLVNIGASTQPI